MTVTNKENGREAVYFPLGLNIDESNINKSKECIALYLSAIGACLMTVSCGVSVVWTSPVIWQLTSNNTDINPLGAPLTTSQIAWLTSLMPLGGVFGSLFTKLCDMIGRKRTLILLSSGTILFNLVISFSSHLYFYYFARFIIGACGGISIAVMSVFLSEISEDHNRGKIGCFMGLSIPLGNLYVYLLGPMFPVKVLTLLCSIPNIINILCLITYIPESPFYLASKGKRQETMNALARLRNKKPNDLELEYEIIIQTLTNITNEEEVSWKTMFTVRSLRKGFIIAITLSAIQQLSGISAILAYAGPLFNASGISLTGDTVGILIGLSYVFGALLAILVIERLGRRPLLMVSTLFGSVPHFLLGLFFYLKNSNSPFLNDILWLPTVSVLLFVVVYAVGLGVIPQAMMSELFPSNAKSKASSASCFLCFFIFFIIATLFPILNDLIGPSWCLWLFGLIEALSFVFVYFSVPEIKGKSLLEVQQLLSK